jgi:hypothetical protein
MEYDSSHMISGHLMIYLGLIDKYISKSEECTIVINEIVVLVCINYNTNTSYNHSCRLSNAPLIGSVYCITI